MPSAVWHVWILLVRDTGKSKDTPPVGTVDADVVPKHIGN